MAATDVKIVGICIESRPASNGTSPDIPNPKKHFLHQPRRADAARTRTDRRDWWSQLCGVFGILPYILTTQRAPTISSVAAVLRALRRLGVSADGSAKGGAGGELVLGTEGTWGIGWSLLSKKKEKNYKKLFE